MKEYKYTNKEESVEESIEDQGKGRIELDGEFVGKNIEGDDKEDYKDGCGNIYKKEGANLFVKYFNDEGKSMTLAIEGFQEGDYGLWLEEEAPYYLEGDWIVETSTGEKKELSQVLALEDNSWLEEDQRIKDGFLWIYKGEEIKFTEEEGEGTNESSDQSEGEACNNQSNSATSSEGSATGMKGSGTDGSSRGNPNSSSGSSVGDGKRYYLCDGAELKCKFGDDESKLNILDIHKVYIQGKPMATMMDNKPTVNIKPFGKCKSMANPTVAAATASNRGRLKKMPCIPVIPAPWLKAKMDVKIKGNPTILEDAKLNCAYAGVIEVVDPGQDLVKG